MRNRPVHRRSSVAVIAACSLLFAACGGGSEEIPSASAPPTTEAAPAETGNIDEGAADTTAAPTTVDAEPAPSTAPSTAPPTAPTTTPATAPATTPPTAAPAPTTTAPADDPALLTAVFRPAIERASADASYSFAMGMQLDMSMQGFDITMGDAGVAFATGTQDGARTYMRTDIGSWMSSMFDSMFGSMLDGGAVPDDEVDQGAAMLSQILAVFDDMSMETWVDADEGVMVIDAAEFYSSLVDLGGITGGEADQLAVLAEGPILVRVDEMSGALGEVYGSLGVSTGMATPEEMVEMLMSATGVREVGPGQVGTHAVTVYAATIDVGAMYDTMGLELTDVLGPGPDSQELADAIDGFVMDIVVMIDDDGLLRRIEIELDMTGMLADLDPQAAAQLGAYTMSMWQEFDQHGESFPFEPPAATDITDLYDDLFAQPII